MSKNYFDYVSEISSDDLYKGLLAHGLFSEKLPQFLTSEPFYNYCCSQNHSFSGQERLFIDFESIRHVNIPRLFGIPNPFAYQRLCDRLRKNWGEIQDHFKRNTFLQGHKISRIHLRKMHNKNALFEMNYDNWRVDKSPIPDLLIGKYYVVKADISTCFPSIYSHAIPWALVGVDRAKVERADKFWFNKIDIATRNCKYGETHGLLIGPHASNLISEIILVRVDAALYEKGWRYIRNIDDYECYVKSFEDAERFLLELSQELRKYDLSLNAKKTEIKPLPKASEDHWVRKINLFVWPDKEKTIRYPIIKAYMDFVIDLMHSNNDNAAILNYAMKVVADFSLTENAKEYYYKTIFHLVLIYPYLLSKLDEYLFEKFDIPEETIQKIADKIYKTQYAKLNYEGVCFALYFAIKYNFKLFFDIVAESKKAIQSSSCLFKLLMFLYLQKFEEESSCDGLRQHARDLKSDENDMNRNWLFVYEVLSSDELDQEWKALKKQKVSFVIPQFRL